MAGVNKEDDELDVQLDKKDLKAMKKDEKKKNKNKSSKARKMEDDEDEEESGGGFTVVLVTFMILLVWIGILALLIKMDVGGFGSTVLRPIIQDVPYLNNILPSTDLSVDSQDIDATEYPYATLEEAMTRIAELESQLQQAQSTGSADADYVTELEQKAAQLEQYKSQEADFLEQKRKFDEEVVFSDQAPDISEYKSFYESIEPENAETIYRQVIEQTQIANTTQSYVDMYSSMKPKQAAAIFDTMTDDLTLVSEILKNMEADSSSDILGAMNAQTAAKLTKIMNPE